MNTSHARNRLLVPGLWLMLLGLLALAAATDRGRAVGLSHGLLLAAVAGAVLLLIIGRSKSDLAAVARSDRDERQTLVDLRARSIAAIVLLGLCGFQAAHMFWTGHPRLGQPYLIMAIIGVSTYLISLVGLARRA